MNFNQAAKISANPDNYTLQERAEAWKFFHEEIMDAENENYKVECNLACSRIIETDMRAMRM